MQQPYKVSSATSGFSTRRQLDRVNGGTAETVVLEVVALEHLELGIDVIAEVEVVALDPLELSLDEVVEVEVVVLDRFELNLK